MELYHVTGHKTGINSLVLAHDEQEAIQVAVEHNQLTADLAALVMRRLTANKVNLRQYEEPKYLL